MRCSFSRLLTARGFLRSSLQQPLPPSAKAIMFGILAFEATDERGVALRAM
jgi:hypothetical protein